MTPRRSSASLGPSIPPRGPRRRRRQHGDCHHQVRDGSEVRSGRRRQDPHLQDQREQGRRSRLHERLRRSTTSRSPTYDNGNGSPLRSRPSSTASKPAVWTSAAPSITPVERWVPQRLRAPAPSRSAARASWGSRAPRAHGPSDGRGRVRLQGDQRRRSGRAKLPWCHRHQRRRRHDHLQRYQVYHREAQQRCGRRPRHGRPRAKTSDVYTYHTTSARSTGRKDNGVEHRPGRRRLSPSR